VKRNSVSPIASEIQQRIRELPSARTESVRAVRREFSKKLQASDRREVISIARELLDQNEFVFRWVAYELVSHHPAALATVRASDLKAFGQGMDSWGAVDTFGLFLAGPVWREGQVDDALIHRWARSPDLWWRRAALVSTVALNNKARGGRGDIPRTLDVCRALVNDREDMVVKALSWALREASKRDPGAVRAFIQKHSGSLASRVVREVGNKLHTGLKNPRAKTARRATR
jgi:3-methyladenine DNA glycosylase AlkD